MSDLYILSDTGAPVPEPDVIKWGQWYENREACRVDSTHVGNARVSTVFLGMDYSLGDAGGPILWETMVFGGPLHEERDRCGGNREQAEAMHSEMIRRVTLAANAENTP